MSLKTSAFVSLAALSMTACNKKNNDQGVSTKTSFIQVVHSAPKTGELEVEINGQKLSGKVAYLNSSGVYNRIKSDTAKEVPLKISFNNTVVAEGKISLANNEYYSLFLHDTLGTGKKIKYAFLKDDLAAPGAGLANVRFLHLSVDAPAADIDLLGKDSIRLVTGATYIGSTPDIAKLSAFTKIKAGDYRVKVKVKKGTKTETILEVPVVKLEANKSTTLCLRGLTKGMGGYELGMHTWQHK